MKNPKNKQTYARTRICIYMYDNDKFSDDDLLIIYVFFLHFTRREEKKTKILLNLDKI